MDIIGDSEGGNGLSGELALNGEGGRRIPAAAHICPQHHRVIGNPHFLSEFCLGGKGSGYIRPEIPQHHSLAVGQGDVAAAGSGGDGHLFAVVIDLVQVIQFDGVNVGVADFDKLHQVRGAVVKLDGHIAVGSPFVVGGTAVYVVGVDFREPKTFDVESGSVFRCGFRCEGRDDAGQQMNQQHQGQQQCGQSLVSLHGENLPFVLFC